MTMFLVSLYARLVGIFLYVFITTCFDAEQSLLVSRYIKYPQFAF